MATSAPPKRSLMALRPSGRLYLRICRAVETPLAVALLLMVFVATNVAASGASVNDLLAIRVKVKNLLFVAGFAACWRIACGVFEVYAWRRVREQGQELVRVVAVCTVMSLIALIFPAISLTGAFRYTTVLWFWLGSCMVLVGLRVTLRSLTAGNLAPVRDILIVGSGPRAERLYHEVQQDAQHGRVVGFVDTCDEAVAAFVSERLMGSLAELEVILVNRAIDEVLIALPVRSRYAEIEEAIRTCGRVGVRAKCLADIFERDHPGSRLPSTESAVLDMPVAVDDYRLLIKRLIDIALTAVVLIAASPMMVAAALGVKLTSPGPVIFVQERYGHNRRRFRMYKFRTMVHDAEELQHAIEGSNEASGPVFKIRRDPRLTRLGAFLRRTSIDELPQLFNVLRGDMSLVGPRPLPIRDVQHFPQAALMRRFSVRPGITCLWQVSGRSDVDFDGWIALDLQYIDEWSLGLDLSILARTLPAVVKGTGAA
jgi:exopolysaccharide biosynthesis polyprenyl glycosylphosphotransferase